MRLRHTFLRAACSLSLLTTMAYAQTSRSPASRTTHPDLQGIWTNQFATPLERPKDLANRPTLTEREVTALNQQSRQAFKAGRAMVVPTERTLTALLTDPSQFASGATYDSAFFTPLEFENRTSLITDPPDGRLPRYTTAGQARLAVRDTDVTSAQELPPSTRCISFGMPRIAGVAGTTSANVYAYYQIVQAPNAVLFFMEAVHEARIIRLDGSPHLPSSIRTWDGDSRGHWDGDVLVVDTTNFRPEVNFLGAGEHLRLIERFRRVGADELDYEVRVEDATTWTQPWVAMVRLKRTGERLYEFGCHEGNAPIIKAILTALPPK